MKHLKLYEEYNSSKGGHPGFITDLDDIIDWLIKNTTFAEFKHIEKEIIKKCIYVNEDNSVDINVTKLHFWDILDEYVDYEREWFDDDSVEHTDPNMSFDDFNNWWDDRYDDLWEIRSEYLLHTDWYCYLSVYSNYILVDINELIGASFRIMEGSVLKSLRGVPKYCSEEITIDSFADIVSIEFISGSSDIYIDTETADVYTSLIVDSSLNKSMLIDNKYDRIAFIDRGYKNIEEQAREFADRLSKKPISVIPEILYNLRDEVPEIYSYLFNSDSDVEEWLSRLQNTETHKDIINL